MDPNAALRDLRDLVKDIFADNLLDFDREDYELAGKLQDIAERFDAIDHWLTCGGFLPKDWERQEKRK